MRLRFFLLFGYSQDIGLILVKDIVICFSGIGQLSWVQIHSVS